MEVIATVVNNRLYDSQLVTMKICYCSDIHCTQTVSHLCLKISTHYPAQQKAQFAHDQ